MTDLNPECTPKQTSAGHCRSNMRGHARRAGFGVFGPVYSHGEKYFHFLSTQITSISAAVSSHTGAYRDRHGREMRCGGRGLLQACERSELVGRVSPSLSKTKLMGIASLQPSCALTSRLSGGMPVFEVKADQRLWNPQGCFCPISVIWQFSRQTVSPGGSCARRRKQGHRDGHRRLAARAWPRKI
jgi:hypothetical protein